MSEFEDNNVIEYSEIYNPNSIPHRYKYFSGSIGGFSDGRLFFYSNY